MIKSLYKCFQHWSKTGSVYIISDTHFEDFDCELMDKDWISPEEQVKIINDIVKKNDTLICLGDVGNVEWFKHIKAGYKVLITGNHDKGREMYEKQINSRKFDSDKYTKREALEEMKKLFPNCKYIVNEEYSFHSPFTAWKISADNMLFDEVYTGPLFISEKILISHEPIYGLSWCLNIHGHDHSNIEAYKEGCKHLNLAANICGYTPINLGKLIKDGIISDIESIHRQTVDRASERKAKLNEIELK